MGRLLTLAGALAALLLAPVAGADEFDLSVDVRAVSTDATQTRLTGGLGKLRYDEQTDGLQLGYVRLGYRGDVTQTVRVAAELVAYGDRDVNATGLTELYGEWRPIPSSAWRSRVKLGAFYPEISLENRMRGWRSPYTLSFSAVNTWVSEELRTIGAEYSIDWLGRSHGHNFDFSLNAAAYGWNDTAGTVIATRGWGLHDRQSVWLGRYADGGTPLPPRTIFYNDLDKRAGYYAGAAANLAAGSVRIQDNAWLTYFESVGARWTPNDDWTVIGQWLHGRTYEDAELPNNAWSYHAEFLLASLRRGAMRYSVRYDRFHMQQTYSSYDDYPVLLGDDGHAWTVALIRDLGRHWSAALEGIQSESSVPLRTVYGQNAYAREQMLQLALRYEL